MKNKNEESNDDIKEEFPLIENKNDDNSQHSGINLNKNNMNSLYKLLINDDYYLISQNINKSLKSYHKLIMQNIGKMNKILLNNNAPYSDNESISTEIKENINENNTLITILSQIELSHNNFYLNTKKLLLKINKHYNKRKKKLKKYKIIEDNKYSFTFGLISKLKNNHENDDNINHQINSQKFNNNSNQVIINNIQNIINTVDNKSNTNNLNQNDYPSLLKENQLLKQKLININANQKSEITNYINYIENKIKNDNNDNIIKIEEEEIKENKKNHIFENLEKKNEMSFEYIIIKEKTINEKEKKEQKIMDNFNFYIICQKENEDVKNLKEINKELSDTNNGLNEKIESLNLELKKIKEEKTDITLKNELTEKKILQLNTDIDNLKKTLEQKEADIEELNEKMEEVKQKNTDLENQKGNLQNKLFSCMSKINDLSANYENLQKEKETEITDYKEYLIKKEEALDELRSRNKQSMEKVTSLEKIIKLYTNQNNELRSEIIEIKKSSSTYDFKIKQNEKTISYLNKQNSNLTIENENLQDQIKILNKDIKEHKKTIKELNNKSKYDDNEGDTKEVINCKDKEITFLKKIVNVNKEELLKKDNEIQSLNDDLAQALSENKKLKQDLDSLEGENKDAIQSFNELNKKYKDVNKELNHLKRYYEPYEDKLVKKDEELNISIKNYNFLQKTNRRIMQENEEYKKQIEKYKKEMDTNKNSKNNNMDVIRENNQLKTEIKEMDDEIEDLNKKLEDQSEEIIYYKSSLSNEQNKNLDLEKKMKELNKKLEELQKLQKENNNKYSSRDYRSNVQTSNETPNNNNNSNDNNMKDITPSKYAIIKCVEIEELKWYLFKKKNNKSLVRKYSQRTSSLSNKTYYYTRHEKIKSNNVSETTTPKDNYNDYVWVPMKNQKEFNDFGTLPQCDSIDNKNKINEMEKEIKELKDKCIKKEDDYNRININYAKLLKKNKNPESQEKLLETINKLKIENKKLNTSLLKFKSEKNIISISFIEDDLEASFFIDNFCFDTILDELDKSENKFMAMNNTLQKTIKSSHDRKKTEDIKLDNNNNKEEKDESGKNDNK